jgi:hypothetical protein
MKLETYSMGVGDRFARQGKAQLRAMMLAAERGVAVAPVWNKSHREHTIIGSTPADVRAEADAAVAALAWTGGYHVDADHIGLATVDGFLEASDFFTLDVAEFTGKSAPDRDVRRFVSRHSDFLGSLEVPGIGEPLAVTEAEAERIARTFLLAVREAGRIYRHIVRAKGDGTFVTEVSMDETGRAQTPVEMLFILAAMADEGIPAGTIAPKFTGRFNKGVDYVGDADRFAQEFEQDLAVIAFAVRELGLPAGLKLSVHSGSDKFSLYPIMRTAIRRDGAGLHLKTAGTTWLEELVGLAAAGGAGLALAAEVYGQALARFDELCGPYAPVLDIDRTRLPASDVVDGWDGEAFVAALRHDPGCEAYNPDFRQLLHVAYKVAAEMGERYLSALARYEDSIGPHVTANLFERHVRPLFVGD